MVVGPTTPAPDAAAAAVSVSPACPQPGPRSTVGSRCVADAPGAGNQWARILVPSNEVTSQSLATPATLVTTGFTIAAGVHFAGVVGAGLAFVVDDAGGAAALVEEEQAA